MKVTKYEHACLVLEEDDNRLVIDPGSFTKSLPAKLDNVVGIVITHVHADHFDPAHIKHIEQQNPTLDIFCTEEVAKQLDFKSPKVVTGGSSGEVGPFKLAFFGGQHAAIHESYPTAQNVGVFVNNKLYYPGDSFTPPESKVPLLALPVSAPWLKLSEVMDYLTAVAPTSCFPTHNALLSEIGENLVESMLAGVAQSANSKLSPLAPGQSIEV